MPPFTCVQRTSHLRNGVIGMWPGARSVAEASARRKFDTAVLREAISAAVKAHGSDKGLSEITIEPRTDPKFIRNAPNYGTVPESGKVEHPYTLEGLAKFLGFVAPRNKKATESFIAAFGAEELIADGVLKESQIKGLSAERLGELVISVRKHRDAANPHKFGGWKQDFSFHK